MSSGAADVICPVRNIMAREWQNMLNIVTLNFLGRRWLWTLHCAATYSNSIAQTREKKWPRRTHMAETQFDSRELPVPRPPDDTYA